MKPDLSKVKLFTKLWLFASTVRVIRPKVPVPEGIHGVAMGLFSEAGELHSVVVFPVPRGTKIEELSDDLFHIWYGWSSWISLPWDLLLHLFARDKWGEAFPLQVLANPFLIEVRKKFPETEYQLILAGARQPLPKSSKIYRWIYQILYFFLYGKASNFILAKKAS